MCESVCTVERMDKFVVREKRARVDDGQPTVVELFAGAGGMAIGLERAGLRHVALVEWDKHCVSSLRRIRFKNVIHRNAPLNFSDRPESRSCLILKKSEHDHMSDVCVCEMELSVY